NLGNACLAVGDLAGAQSAFARYADNCRALGLETELIVARLNGALVAAEKGDPSALDEARAVAERATRLGRHFVAAAAKTAEAQALARTGRPQAALAPLDEALAIAERIQNRLLEEHVRAYRVEAFLWLGDHEAAGAEADRLEALVTASGHAEMAARLRVHRAELQRLAGDVAGAILAAEALTADSNRVAVHRAWQLLAMLKRDRAAAEAATAIARQWDAPWHLAADHLLEAHAAEPQKARQLAEEAIACEVNPYAAAGAALLLGELGAGLPAAALAPLEHALEALDDSTRRRVLDSHGLAALAIAPAPAATGLDVRRYAQWVEAVAMGTDEAAIARCALEGVIDLVHADRGYLLTYEDGRLKKALTKGLDYETEMAEGFSRSIVEHALFSAQPVYSANASEDAAWKEAQSVMALALRTVVCLPLLTPTSLLGAIYIDRAAVEPLLSEEDVALLGAFATAAAGAIVRERARLRADLGRATLQTVAGRLLVGRTEELAGALLEAAIEAADAECAFYLVPGADEWRAIAGRARQGRAIGYRAGMASRGVLEHVRDTREPFTLLDMAEAEGWQARESVQALGLRTVWCLPVGTPDGAIIYLDTTKIAIADPTRVLQALETLVAFCRPLLNS
ncbi:MAG TPA: GAF domain-containing protein, partial [Oscillatoriaceae cyanobacterium]